jgi:MFS family permease
VLDASAFQVALLGTVEFLPFLLFTLPAGVWVDRLRRRPILVIADFGRAAALVSVPVAYAFDVLTIWQLYVVGFVVGTLTVFFDVAYQSYLPSLIRRNQLVDGNSKLELSVSAAQLGGPATAGGLVSLLTAPWAVLTDAISFLGSALFVLRIRKREEVIQPAATAERRGMRAEAWEGMQFVFRDRRLRALTESTVIFNFCANGAFAVYLVYAVRSLGLSPAAIGVIFSLGNVGWLAGALLAGRLSARLGVGRTIIFTGLLAAPALMLVPAAPQSTPIPFLIAAGVISSFGLVIWRVAQVSLRQAITPDHMLGRVNAVSRFLMWGTIPLGTLLGGALGSTIGLRETLWIGTIGASFTVLPVLFSPVRALVSVPDMPDGPHEADAVLEPMIGVPAVGMDDPRA